MAAPKDTVLIFDYDGTLNCSEKVYVPVFLKAYDDMVAEGVAEPRDWTLPEITKYLGCSKVEMWADFMPDGDPAVTEKYAAQIGGGMIDACAEGKAEWYAGVEETLQALHEKGYRMVALSNCRIRYMAVNRENFQMDRFFEGYYACEAYGFAPKTEIFNHILKEHPAAEYIAIGDRRHDMELAKVHGLRSIGCLYGYGTPEELSVADQRIEQFSDLLEIL